MKFHELKTWQKYFNPALSGAKTFECRENDRAFEVGDVLRLREFMPLSLGSDIFPASKSGTYTGRDCFRRITYILSDWPNLAPNHVILAMVPTDPRGYEKRTDSPTNQFISMVTGETLADDDAWMGCSACWNALTGYEAEYNKLLASEWSQCGEEDMLCPFCTREANADAKELYELENGPIQ